MGTVIVGLPGRGCPVHQGEQISARTGTAQ